MPKKQLYETRNLREQLTFWNSGGGPLGAHQQVKPPYYRTLHSSRHSATQGVGGNHYYYTVYADNWGAFVGYADVENPTTAQIRSHI